MENWLDKITYGNPTDKYLEFLKKGPYDSLLEPLMHYPFPSNSCEATKDELRELMNYQNSPENKNEKLVKRYMLYDQDLILLFKKYAKEKIGQEMDDLIDDCIKDIKPILTKVKFKFQRPRPYQLAEYYKIRLFPYCSRATLTPSYPSGHTFQAVVLTELIGNKYPEHYEYLSNLTQDIATSRVFLGLHYPTDNDFAYICAKAVTTSKEFNSKYGI